MRVDWRDWLSRLARLWRGSLRVRTVAITVALSTVAITIIGAYISTSVSSNLFDQRLLQVKTEASKATMSAQQVFTQAEDLNGTVDLEGVEDSATNAIRATVSSAPLIAILRVPGQTGASLMENRANEGFDAGTMLSSQLASTVQNGGRDQLSWQSISIARGSSGQSDPGIIVGSLLEVPAAGEYQLYLVYNLKDVQQTLDFVQRTLVLGGLALVLLIGAVAYLIVRLIVGPVRQAAESSEKLAAGQLEERLRERGSDELATLARSFNRMADSLQRQIRQLADLSRLQQRFVSDVSHELRTPLTTIRLAGDVLYDQRASFPPATARTAELLHAQTERFEVLLADLLEMSRYDSGAVQLETDPTNLVRLVEEAIDAVAPLAEEKGTEIRLIAPGGYFEADVDARRIRRILQNLLGNAIDHGEGLPIDVYVDSDADAVAIAVRDHGIGMSESDMERVFDRFWRADPSRQRTTGGTGLGLAISLEDAVVHGGLLDVWSEPGQGSCFRLTLPRQFGAAVMGSPLPLPPEEEAA
ncbi:MtrAB system histidine kinase MtrB [Lysinimonas soli]|uniref:Sensor histidine kinase MtrB n=1 Tax=Lysinimonas soli TaxID=1074233 RepID=A0ABW0NVQ6_9MICO